MPRNTVSARVALSIVVTLVLMVTATYTAVAYAIGMPTTIINLYSSVDINSTKGFESAERIGGRFGVTPELVLARGRTGEVNITFTSAEKNDIIHIYSLKYSGVPPWNKSWDVGGIPEDRTPDGITYSIKPANLTLTPGSTMTVTLQISTAPDTAIRNYSLSLAYSVNKTNYPDEYRSSRDTVLTIIEGVSPPTNTTNTTMTTTSCVNQTFTLTRTITITTSNTTTSTITTAATPNLSATTTSTQTKGTVSTTFTSTSTSTTTETHIERVAEPSIYAWAMGATAIATALAIVLLRRKKS